MGEESKDELTTKGAIRGKRVREWKGFLGLVDVEG